MLLRRVRPCLPRPQAIVRPCGGADEDGGEREGEDDEAHGYSPMMQKITATTIMHAKPPGMPIKTASAIPASDRPAR